MAAWPCWAAAQTAGAAPPAVSPETDKPGFWQRLHDPQDGRLDLSDWLLNHRGVLPVPIVITEPALGYGGGVALAFFHRPEGSAATRTTASGQTRFIAPNLYGAMGMKTENGSHAYGGGAVLHFDEDRWRYKGGVGKASFNLDFYTQGRLLPAREVGYNVDGLASFQQVARRLGDEDVFVGVSWIYMDLDVTFDSAGDRQFFSDRELAQKSSGLGLMFEYDTRDNPFTPSRGWTAVLDANFYREGFGGDVDFDSYRAHAFAYWPLSNQRFVVGARLDLRAVGGDVPFYRLPYVDMRGIAAGRYQDRRAAMAESEWRWNLTPRWAVLGFVGAGRAWGRKEDFGDATTAVAKGAGFRYLLARKLGLYGGLDYAWGPDDHTFYIQMGSAWR
ncbi:BamA/TamA family outer membrane protein [Stenotrophomonas sp. HITSZ_GD]|uniref:BamA/TamA family outer membrane protein n=1 Tax=Stenotrophomonas sp. HITSZ_GD TaxID=3037248 RepID=UPI00240D027F|nr:BamA/TamA family outer membrane protein [Stenotrophomonas sp. HITSZ_GD]MDG2527037.1 BamA/TamA family outer membrane protein [Stenotrophomonas sp. HITSZ_GD]